MKFLAPALIFCGATAFGQSPQVPHKMQFAGLTLTIHDDARREIQKDVDALTLHPKYFNVKAERAKTYFPIIEKIFAEERLPDDFKYLCLQESALVPDAVSSSNAVGFWQFKDFTAREMGLRVDDEIDERMNIASASRGAARYIKQCNHYFNNWVYALQAYQMGAGGVMRAVGDKNLGARHMDITMDTYWYVRKYIAHKVAFENAVGGKPAQEVTHFYAGGKSIEEIAKEGAVDEERLRQFNKWLKTDRIPVDREYAVLVPHGPGTAEFGTLMVIAPKSKEAASTEVVEEMLEVNGIAVIRAIKGESLTAIAKRGNLSLQSFLHNNEMTIDQPIRAGDLYFLHKKKKRATQELYTLKPGEDIWTVSQRFGIQQKSVLKFNAIRDPREVTPGTTLYLSSRKPAGADVNEDETTVVAEVDEDATFNWDQPMKSGTASLKVLPDGEGFPNADVTVLQAGTVVSGAEVHEVKSTDTLYSVARQYGVTIKELMDWNGKKDFSLSVGEKLKVRSN